MILLRQVRESQRMSQTKLSELSGVAQTTISDIENEVSSPTVRVLVKLARALDVSISDLVDEDAVE